MSSSQLIGTVLVLAGIAIGIWYTTWVLLQLVSKFSSLSLGFLCVDMYASVFLSL